jgi:hypothetical protein
MVNGGATGQARAEKAATGAHWRPIQLREWRIHDLRYAFAIASLIDDATCIYTLMNHLGHSPVETTEMHTGTYAEKVHSEITFAAQPVWRLARSGRRGNAGCRLASDWLPSQGYRHHECSDRCRIARLKSVMGGHKIGPTRRQTVI